MKLISWNIAGREEAWRAVADSGADIALLQEATAPPADVAARVEVDDAPWLTEGAGSRRPWRAAVVRLNRQVEVEWLRSCPLAKAEEGELAVSREGTLAAARVFDRDGQPLILLSMYGLWERPHESTDSAWIYADASVHRLISDVASLVGREKGHRIVAAGDLNVLHGYGEEGSPYWARRYATVFERMRAMGVPFVGPQSPEGRQADPWPAELPRDSRNVPTFRTNSMSPGAEQRQLDHVFASSTLAGHVRVRAVNAVGDWGPSDHCRLEIDLT